MPETTLLVPKRRTTFRLVLAMLLGFAMAGAAGWYAWDLRGEHQDTVKALSAAQVARDDAKFKLAQVQTRDGELDKLVAECTKERDLHKQTADSQSKDLASAQADLAATKEELEGLRKLRAETEKRLQAFKDLTARFRKMIDTGKLQVVIREGKMVVKLPAGVLFPSGSAELSKDGGMALMEVAVVLKELKDRRFMIVGHTDNVPLGPQSPSAFKDNWELSTARALTVTKFLIDAGMRATHLVAAGQSEYDPVAGNKTENGRKENRRIEIVLMPNLAEMPPMPSETAAK